MYERPVLLGQVRLVSRPALRQSVNPTPTPVGQVPPGMSPIVIPTKLNVADTIFGAGLLAAIGTAAYAIFS